MELEKLLEIPAFDSNGEPNTRILTRMDASVFEKTAGTLPKDVADFLKELKPDPKNLYALIVALGAADVWGMNSNGDAFYEASLLGIQTPMEASRNPEPFTNVPLQRYKTFLSAHAFRSHINKDPQTAFGKVAASIYDHDMHRVLLVVAADREKAPDIVKDIEDGSPVTWSMGCFTEDAMVQMADGTHTKIAEMSPGMQVVTHLGNIGSVANVQKRWYSGDVYDIEVFGVDGKLTTTPEHPFWASELDRFCRCGCGQKLENHNSGRKTFNIPRGRKFKPGHHRKFLHLCPEVAVESLPDMYETPLVYEFTEAKHLSAGDFLLSPAMSSYAGAEFEGYNITPKLARALGYFLAEGSFHKSARSKQNYGIVFTFHSEETEYAREVSEAFMESFGLKAHIHKTINRPNCMDVRFFSKDVSGLLKKMCGEYCDKKRIPQSFLAWPKHLQMELLGAYLNGDASIDNTQIEAGTASSILAHQIHAMATNCGIPSMLCLNRDNSFRIEAGHKPIYFVEFNAEALNQLAEFCDVRKKFVRSGIGERRRCGPWNGSVYRQIRSINIRHYEGYVYNFEVEGDNSYVVNDVAVHNCKVAHDRCSICNHKAKNVSEYCEHLKTAMGQTWSNGHKVFAINDTPRFFDISRVLIPADKTAMTLMKVASAGQKFVLLGDDGTGCGAYSRSGVLVPSAIVAERVKVAAAKAKQASEKSGEIKKEVPVGPVEEASDSVGALVKDVVRANKLSSKEKVLSNESIRKLASVPRHQALSSLAALGVVLRPSEFAKLSSGGSFVDAGAINQSLVADLVDVVQDRSALSPWVEEREAALEKEADGVAEDTSDPQYLEYRESLNHWDVDVSIQTISKHAHLLAEHRTASAEDLACALFGMSKAAKVGKGAILAGGIGTGLALPYLASAHYKLKQEKGQELNPVQKLVADHHLPLAVAGAVAGGVGAYKLSKLIK